MWDWALETDSAGQLHTFHDLRANDDLEIVRVGASIKLIGNVTTVHNLTINVDEVLVWHFFVL
jgi:hypothetical protein